MAELELHLEKFFSIKNLVGKSKTKVFDILVKDVSYIFMVEEKKTFYFE